MSFYVAAKAKPPAFDQFNSPTHDLHPDENAVDNCWAGVTCSLLKLYGVHRPDGSDYEPDDVKDYVFQQGTTGAHGTNVSIMNALAHFGGLASITQTPSECHNYRDGLMDRIWQSLHDHQIPVASAVWYVGPTGLIYDGKHKDSNGLLLPAIGHWRLVWALSDTAVGTMDPAGGQYRQDTWDGYWALSRNVLVAPVTPL